MAPPPRQYVPAPGMNKPAAARVTRDTKTYLRRPGAAPPPAGGQAPHAHAPVDPYANPQAYIAKAVASLGTPLTDAQIQSNAQAQLAPLIKALQDSISAQATSGTNAINGYTSNLAQHLAGFQQNAQNIYGGAEQSQAASDAALSQKLSGEGGQQAQDLGAKLASINAPGAVNQAVQGATGEAAGAGNALYATGGASLANLIASGAAEQSYASKQPGIAGLAGAQQVGNLQGELAKNLADQTGQLQGKVPDIVNSLEGQRTDLQGKRASLTQDLNQFFSDRGFKKKALAQERNALHQPDSSLTGKFGYAVDKSGNPVLDKNGNLRLLPGYHTNAKGNVVKDAKPKGAPKVNTTLSAANKYLTDSSGNPILKNGQRQPYQPKTSPTSQPKAPSNADRARWDTLAGKLYNGVQSHYHPVDVKKPDGTTVVKWVPVPGTGAPPATWDQAVKRLISNGVPSRAKAVALLTAQGWKPGEGGRPYTPEQQSGLNSAAGAAGAAARRAFGGIGGF